VIKRRWIKIAGGFAYLALGFWLYASASWPGQCDHSGNRGGGWLKRMWCSPELLSGGIIEIGLFFWLWFATLGGLVWIIWPLVERMRRKRGEDRLE
jgi:hypothetical protein